MHKLTNQIIQNQFLLNVNNQLLTEKSPRKSLQFLTLKMIVMIMRIYSCLTKPILDLTKRLNL